MNLFTLGWRNIWRNKRRTLITVSSVMFAVLFATVMQSFQEGSYSNATDNMVRMVSGHIQIHSQGYWDDQIIDNIFTDDSSMQQSIAKFPGVKYALPRLQYFSFISTGNTTREAIIMGLNPELEEPVAKIEDKIKYGHNITSQSTGVVLGQALAKSMKVIRLEDSLAYDQDGNITDTLQKIIMLNDTIVLLGQGYHGATAAGKFHVDGIVKIPIPEIDKRIVYLPLQQAQYFFNAPNMLSSINIHLHDADDLEDVEQQLVPQFDQEQYEVMPWYEMQKELLQQIESDRGSGRITIYLLYLIIGFGIFGTIIMMATERKKEFGIMIAIGMQKTLLCKQIAVELLYMGIIGIGAGIIISMPILTYYYINPIRFTGELAETYESFGWEAIMPISFDPSIFIQQAIVVFILFAISSIYALSQILRLDVKTAIHK